MTFSDREEVNTFFVSVRHRLEVLGMFCTLRAVETGAPRLFLHEDDVDECLIFDSLSTHTSPSVWSSCGNLGPDCTHSLTAWTLHLLCAGKHIRHPPSLNSFCLFLTSVWNHLCCLCPTASGHTWSVWVTDVGSGAGSDVLTCLPNLTIVTHFRAGVRTRVTPGICGRQQ